jgi:hypothetical protein
MNAKLDKSIHINKLIKTKDCAWIELGPLAKHYSCKIINELRNSIESMLIRIKGVS